MFWFHKLGVKHDVTSLKVIVLYANQLLKLLLKLCNVTLAPSISQETGSHHLTRKKTKLQTMFLIMLYRKGIWKQYSNHPVLYL